MAIIIPGATSIPDSRVLFAILAQNDCTLKSLIEEHARLDFSDFLSTLLAIFHVINEKFHPARLLIYLVNK